LEEAWRPLLVYIQELYNCPVRLDGLRPMKFAFSISRTDVVLKAKNFIYERPQVYDATESRVFKSLNAIFLNKATMKGGFTTTLTVHIPKRRNHPFWLLDINQPDDKLFGWDNSEDALSFQVTRWGPIEDYSNFHATQRAKDIVRNIRAAVSNPTHLITCISGVITHISNYSLDSCSVFCLGVRLNQMWKNTKLTFSSICTEQTMEHAVSYIQEIIDSNISLELSSLLKYYQVYSYIIN
jgi:hypothetical protein